MEQTEIKSLLDVRSKLINLYNFLEGKKEPSAMISQKAVAINLEPIIRDIDNLLKGKVTFS